MSVESESSTAAVPCEFSINEEYFHCTKGTQYFRGQYDSKDAIFKFYSSKEKYEYDLQGCNHNVACSARILFKTDRFPINDTERLPCVIFDAQNAMTIREFVQSKMHATLDSKSAKYTVAHALLKTIYSLLSHGRVHGHIVPDIILIQLSLDTAQLMDFGGFTFEYSSNDVAFASLSSLRGEMAPEGDVFSISSIIYYVWTGINPFHHLASGAHAIAIEIGKHDVPNAVYNPALTKTGRHVLRQLWGRAAIRSCMDILRKKADLNEFGFRNVASGPPPMRDFKMPQGTIGRLNPTLLHESINASAPAIDGVEDPFGYEGINATPARDRLKSFAVAFFKKKAHASPQHHGGNQNVNAVAASSPAHQPLLAMRSPERPHTKSHQPDDASSPRQAQPIKGSPTRPLIAKKASLQRADASSKRSRKPRNKYSSRTLTQIELMLMDALRGSVDREELINGICNRHGLCAPTAAALRHMNPSSSSSSYHPPSVSPSPGVLLSDFHDRVLQGDTPLTAAAAEGDYMSVLFLVEYNLFVACRNAVGETALMLAAGKGHIDIVRLLLAHEANMDTNGMYALHYASAYNTIDCVSEILPFEKESALNSIAWSPLQCAAFDGFTECCLLLLGDFAGFVSGDEVTALMIAAERGHAEVVKMLMPYESRIQKSATGKTALMYAAAAGHSDCVELLVTQEARLVNWTEGGWTALMYAAWENQPECCKKLLKYEKRMTNTEGCFALMCCAQNGHAEAASVIADAESCMTLARSHGWTSMMEAANNGFLGVVKVLADIEAGFCMEDGKTAMMLAAKAGHLPVCEYLVDFEAGFQSYHGSTSLLYAVRENQLPVAEMLYRNQNELMACNGLGLDPIRYAVSLNRLEIATALSYIKEDSGIEAPATEAQATASKPSRSRSLSSGPVPVVIQPKSSSRLINRHGSSTTCTEMDQNQRAREASIVSPECRIGDISQLEVEDDDSKVNSLDISGKSRPHTNKSGIQAVPDPQHHLGDIPVEVTATTSEYLQQQRLRSDSIYDQMRETPKQAIQEYFQLTMMSQSDIEEQRRQSSLDVEPKPIHPHHPPEETDIENEVIEFFKKSDVGPVKNADPFAVDVTLPDPKGNGRFDVKDKPDSTKSGDEPGMVSMSSDGYIGAYSSMHGELGGLLAQHVEETSSELE